MDIVTCYHSNLIWILIFTLFVPGFPSRFCSQCKSSTDPDCENQAPEPKHCRRCLYNDAMKGCHQYREFDYCVVIKIFDKNGTQTGFERDCVAYFVQSEFCEYDNKFAAVKRCYYGCDRDGCNQDNIPSLSLATNCFFNVCTLITVLILSVIWHVPRALI